MLWSLGPSKYCSISFAQFGTNHLYPCQMYCKCGRDYGSLEGVLTHFWFILWTSARRMWPSKNYITLYHCNHCIALVNINILINCDVLLMYFLQRSWLREPWMRRHKPTWSIFPALCLQGCAGRWGNQPYY